MEENTKTDIDKLQKTMKELCLCAEEIMKTSEGGDFLPERLFLQTLGKLQELQKLQKGCAEKFLREGFTVNSIEDMHAALAEYEKKKNGEALARVKKVFSDFMQIYSDRERPEQALEKVRSRLAALSDDEILHMSYEEVEPYRELYTFVGGGDKQQDIIQELYGKFDSEILLAAAAKWLHIRETEREERFPGIRILHNDTELVVEREDKVPKGGKAFINDLNERKLNVPAGKLLRTICCFGLLPVAEECDIAEERARDYLFSKGILQRVYPAGEERNAVYCLSENGEKLLRQQSCAENLFQRKSIALPPPITSVAKWRQLCDCSLFLRSCAEENEARSVTVAFFEYHSIMCAFCKLENEGTGCRFEALYFPNMIDSAEVENLKEFFEQLKKELTQQQKYIFIRADDKAASAEFYRKNMEGIPIVEIFCESDSETLAARAKETMEDIFAEDSVEASEMSENEDSGKVCPSGLEPEDECGREGLQESFAQSHTDAGEEKEADGFRQESAEKKTKAEEEKISEGEASRATDVTDDEGKNADVTESEQEPVHSGEEQKEEGQSACAAEGKSEKLMDCLEWEETPSDADFKQLVSDLINKKTESDEDLKDTVVNAVLLAYAAGLEKDRPLSVKLSAQLRQATNLMADESMYTSEKLSDSFQNPGTDDPVLKFSAYVFAMLRPAMAYDYALENQTLSLFQKYSMYFERLSQFKKLFNEMIQIRKLTAGGFTPAVVALLGKEEETKRFEKSIRDDAAANLTISYPDIRMKGIPMLYNKCFGKGGDLYSCLEIISKEEISESAVALVKEVFIKYTTEDKYDLDTFKIEGQIDSVWGSLDTGIELRYRARDLVIKQFKIRLEIIKRWLEHTEATKNNLGELRKLKGQILKAVAELLDNYNKWKEVHNSNVLLWMLNYLRDYLEGKIDNLKIYSNLLFTGVIGVGNDGLPLLGAEMAEVKFYEPWRNVMRMIATPKRTIEELEDDILGNNISVDRKTSLKDNLHQLEMLGKYLGSIDEIFVVTEAQVKEAESSAECEKEKFRDVLELAYTYNRINENEKERIDWLINRFKDEFYSAKDFALWRRFLYALKQQIDELTRESKAKLLRELEERREKRDSELLVKAAKLIKEDENFAVAEELINRFEAGETDFDIEAETGYERDYFGEFLEKKAYDSLYRVCQTNSGKQLSQFGWRYIKDMFPSGWTKRSKEDCESMVKAWPVAQGRTGAEQVKALVGHLGLQVVRAVKEKSVSNLERFCLDVVPVAKSLPDYAHPIAAFGTQIKSPLNVIVLYGKNSAGQLIDTVSRLNLGGMSIVLMDYFLTESERRQIGEEFHKKSGMNPFLLVDQVLFLYLARLENAERLPAMLKCTLPYTIYQPFNMDGGSTADEMFFGRQSELRTIINPGGACVVYGGRQLGKTALLERVESLCSKPEEKKYAVYVSIHSKKAENEIVAILVKEIEKKTNKGIVLGACTTLKEMCDKLAKLYRDGRFVSMYLLIDEVDAFLSAIADEKYMTIQPLNDLRRESKNNFKFVIAGTHNVCRAKNATAENGIFGQMGTPLCIKPLSPMDALKLLSRPLSYLGFQIGKAHLETILTNTNYYPGILQYFGYKLVDTLTTDYAIYYSASKGNPPFTLVDEQLGRVMGSSDLNESIKDKFRLSLKLDQRYFMIARCLTMCYHMNDGKFSFSVEEIREMADLYNIFCLKNESKDSFLVLLDEMVDMGILIKSEEGEYRLRKNSFVDIMGKDMNELEKEIIENNQEV